MMTWIRYTIFRTYESDRPVIANTHDFFFYVGDISTYAASKKPRVSM